MDFVNLSKVLAVFLYLMPFGLCFSYSCQIYLGVFNIAEFIPDCLMTVNSNRGTSLRFFIDHCIL